MRLPTEVSASTIRPPIVCSVRRPSMRSRCFAKRTATSGSGSTISNGSGACFVFGSGFCALTRRRTVCSMLASVMAGGGSSINFASSSAE